MSWLNKLFGSKEEKQPAKRGGDSAQKYELFRGTSMQEEESRKNTVSYYVMEESMTGVTEYSYYHGKQLLGTANAMVLPSFPVRIQGSGVMLDTEFDKTVFPGVTRELVAPDGKPFGTVIWYGEGTHALNIPGESLVVKNEPGIWRFLRDGRAIAVLKRGADSRLTLMPNDPVRDDLALLMMSFPLLQIAR